MCITEKTPIHFFLSPKCLNISVAGQTRCLPLQSLCSGWERDTHTHTKNKKGEERERKEDGRKEGKKEGNYIVVTSMKHMDQTPFSSTPFSSLPLVDISIWNLNGAKQDAEGGCSPGAGIRAWAGENTAGAGLDGGYWQLVTYWGIPCIKKILRIIEVWFLTVGKGSNTFRKWRN